MARTRSIALQCCSCVISWLSVRTASALESAPLPLPSENSDVFSVGNGLWRVLIALVVVVGIILLIRWFVDRANSGGTGPRGSGKLINIIERKPLGPRQSLLLVQVCDKKVLLHQSKGTLSPLCEVENSGGEV
jgi:flagellar biogenesis protein FliO|tara:strand:- start:4597 stop:4995 length:399 start_codon:yes stop_codon:yes gene_type:complete